MCASASTVRIVLGAMPVPCNKRVNDFGRSTTYTVIQSCTSSTYAIRDVFVTCYNQTRYRGVIPTCMYVSYYIPTMYEISQLCMKSGG